MRQLALFLSLAAGCTGSDPEADGPVEPDRAGCTEVSSEDLDADGAVDGTVTDVFDEQVRLVSRIVDYPGLHQEFALEYDVAGCLVEQVFDEIQDNQIIHQVRTTTCDGNADPLTVHTSTTLTLPVGGDFPFESETTYERAYGANGLTSSLTYTHREGFQVVNTYDQEFEYDAQDRPVRVTTRRDGEVSLIESLEWYDADTASRLQRVDGDGTLLYLEEYTFDTYGRVLTEDLSGENAIGGLTVATWDADRWTTPHAEHFVDGETTWTRETAYDEGDPWMWGLDEYDGELDGSDTPDGTVDRTLEFVFTCP